MTERHAEIIAFPVRSDSSAADEATVEVTEQPDLREAIGEVVREERHEQERTLADVADEAGVSLPYLSEIERGRKDASAEVLTSISRALGLEVPDLLERTADRLRGTATCRAGGGTVLSLAA
ncbi:MAG: helix-turn-helix domain-containing protein [Acidimicrobiales bacterium]